MTPLQIIDTVEAHLRTMSHRAIFEDACLYRAPDGSKCAIGCLIPDELYDPEWDKYGGQHIYKIRSVLNHIGIEMTFELFLALQRMHDDPENWSATGFIGDFTSLRSMYEHVTDN